MAHDSIGAGDLPRDRGERRAARAKAAADIGTGSAADDAVWGAVRVIGPSLSPLERSQVAYAARMAHEGRRVREVSRGRLMVAQIDGKALRITSQGTYRVFWQLQQQARELFQQERARLAEEQHGNNTSTNAA